MTKLPKKLGRCPIVETISEIRFSSRLLLDVVFGVIYQSFSEKLSDFKT